MNEQVFVAAKRLADEVEAALATRAVFPLLGAAGKNGTRMFTLQKFPYSLVYRALDDEVRVIAVANHIRKPGQWGPRR